ncbi:MAG: formylglycine-generating enzyme family protein, partial [Pseudomonadota bacterium]
WEYAARAGSESLFHWGNEEPLACASDHPFGANFLSCRPATARTDPVGRYSANAFGLFGVHGNVWEWVEDCSNTSYSGAPSDGSPWLSGDCTRRMRRSGAWTDTDSSRIRSANRGRNLRDLRVPSTGLRVARDL